MRYLNDGRFTSICLLFEGVKDLTASALVDK